MLRPGSRVSFLDEDDETTIFGTIAAIQDTKRAGQVICQTAEVVVDGLTDNYWRVTLNLLTDLGEQGDLEAAKAVVRSVKDASNAVFYAERDVRLAELKAANIDSLKLGDWIDVRFKDVGRIWLAVRFMRYRSTGKVGYCLSSEFPEAVAEPEFCRLHVEGTRSALDRWREGKDENGLKQDSEASDPGADMWQ